MSSVFLAAEWRSLAMVNYRVDAAVLAPLVPHGTELDFFEGETYVSVVAFLFLKTRVLGIGFPFHRNFQEVNLRFYVRRVENGELRRAAVFIRELVPLPAISLVARWLYNEKYSTASMRHLSTIDPLRSVIDYRWRRVRKDCQLTVAVSGEPKPLGSGSLTQFIADHYWGYSAQPNGDTIEYQVAHPSWLAREADSFEISGDLGASFGERFAETLSRKPELVFVAEGSPVTISKGRRIRFAAAGLEERPH